MFRVFEAATANDVWQKIMNDFCSDDIARAQNSRGGATKEILHAAISIADPRQRWVNSRCPALNVAFALAEVIWIVRGRNDSEFLNYFNSQLPRYAGNSSTYHGAYGYRLRKKFGYDQLERAYHVLAKNPESRQVVLQIWDAEEDFPSECGAPRSQDIPCNISSLLKVRENRLEWLQIMRSNDAIRGLPYNIVQFTCLQEIMAGWLGLQLGQYKQISDSLHIYDQDERADRGGSAVALVQNSDDLMLKKPLSDSVFAKLEQLVECVISSAVGVEELTKRLNEFAAPIAFQNIAKVLCAEGARRRLRRDLAEKMMHGCSNPAYLRLYQDWMARTKPK